MVRRGDDVILVITNILGYVGTLIDEMGVRHGRLQVVDRGPNQGTTARWVCRCDCGKVVLVTGFALRGIRGRAPVISCGCYRLERVTKHGAAGRTVEYRTWAGMNQRCSNPNSGGYARYGGRGITVCEHWRQSFSTFLEDMGTRPDGSSIERIDNDGPYRCWRHGLPQNCRWATPAEQAKNRTSGAEKRIRISDDMVREIRARYPLIRHKRSGRRLLAAELGIHPDTLYLIGTGRKRSDVI